MRNSSPPSSHLVIGCDQSKQPPKQHRRRKRLEPLYRSGSGPCRAQLKAIRQTGDLYNRTRLTPRVKNLFSLFLKWRR
jgi:hypothetical protein